MRRFAPIPIVLAGLLAAFAFAQEAAAPRFEDHPASEVLGEPPAKLDIMNAKPWKHQRSLLRKAAANGPNFAGAYTIATFACGHRCQQVVVIDARTGKLAGELETRAGARYRLESTLLIANPPETIDRGDDKTETAYYRWSGEAFERLGAD